jgi:hypothetical protein
VSAPAATAEPRRRVLSRTPLARAHERLIGGRVSGRPRPVPWSTFQRERYPAAALQLAREAMLALAAGEYGAVVGFAKVAAALALRGAPFDLVALATRVPTDELRHAELAMQMAALLGAGDLADVPITPDLARLEREDPCGWEPAALDALMAEVPAISETLSVALLGACRDRAGDPVARAIFSSLLADEVHHARLGWYYLMWRSPQWTPAERRIVADRIGAVVAGTEHRFWRGRDSAADTAPAAAALGVLDSQSQRAAVGAAMEQEIVPALDALGLGASRAWQRRRRGG